MTRPKRRRPAGEKTSEGARPGTEFGAGDAALADLVARAADDYRAGRFEDAATNYRAALRIAPDMAELHLNLGIALRALGRLEDALGCYERAVALDSHSAEAHYNLGNALSEAGRAADAAAAYQRCLASRPGFADAHNNLGAALYALGRFDAAAASYDRTLDIDPGHAAAMNNLGNVRQRQGRLADARAAFVRALALAPERAEVHLNMGSALQADGRLDEAMPSFERAVSLEPSNVKYRLKRATALLLAGRFREGWAEYEWRFRGAAVGVPPGAGRVREIGELGDRRVLVVAEQGYGDAIQFARYLPSLAELCASVHLECERILTPLLGSVPGITAVHVAGDPHPDFDRVVPLMSLPRLFGTTLESVPADVPYVGAAADRVAAWRDRLAGVTGLKVGIAWAGNPAHENDHNRSLPAVVLEPLTEIPGAVVFSLQVGPGEGELTRLTDGRVFDLAGHLSDFAEAAAAVASLDLMITVDTALAHLAGALARPVWVMLPFDPDWRWLLGRAESPWYPTARLFRQPRPGAWAAVVADVARALAAEACAGPRCPTRQDLPMG